MVINLLPKQSSHPNIKATKRRQHTIWLSTVLQNVKPFSISTSTTSSSSLLSFLQDHPNSLSIILAQQRLCKAVVNQPHWVCSRSFSEDTFYHLHVSTELKYPTHPSLTPQPPTPLYRIFLVMGLGGFFAAITFEERVTSRHATLLLGLGLNAPKNIILTCSVTTADGEGDEEHQEDEKEMAGKPGATPLQITSSNDVYER
ncbi:hypothetical protein BU17DRAFT_69926 [Hysterangium stoloniferum]|nr:hypothetical protein BU17DRAFT_69926 [Hysterangium stoloniferum]